VLFRSLCLRPLRGRALSPLSGFSFRAIRRRSYLQRVVGYHGTDDAESVLREGLLRARAVSLGCPVGHICVAETPELAAMFGRYVIEIDLDGLEGLSPFVGLEARVHGNIPRERLQLYERDVIPSLDGHIDPGNTPSGQHPACLALLWALEAA